jgi:hypothetical protein
MSAGALAFPDDHFDVVIERTPLRALGISVIAVYVKV